MANEIHFILKLLAGKNSKEYVLVWVTTLYDF